jgi:hypothetical protein
MEVLAGRGGGLSPSAPPVASILAWNPSCAFFFAKDTFDIKRDCCPDWLPGGWWLMSICSKRKILLRVWCVICSEWKSTADGWDQQFRSPVLPPHPPLIKARAFPNMKSPQNPNSVTPTLLDLDIGASLAIAIDFFLLSCHVPIFRFLHPNNHLFPNNRRLL